MKSAASLLCEALKFWASVPEPDPALAELLIYVLMEEEEPTRWDIINYDDPAVVAAFSRLLFFCTKADHDDRSKYSCWGFSDFIGQDGRIAHLWAGLCYNDDEDEMGALIPIVQVAFNNPETRELVRQQLMSRDMTSGFFEGAEEEAYRPLVS